MEIRFYNNTDFLTNFGVKSIHGERLASIDLKTLYSDMVSVTFNGFLGRIRKIEAEFVSIENLEDTLFLLDYCEKFNKSDKVIFYNRCLTQGIYLPGFIATGEAYSLLSYEDKRARGILWSVLRDYFVEMGKDVSVLEYSFNSCSWEHTLNGQVCKKTFENLNDASLELLYPEIWP